MSFVQPTFFVFLFYDASQKVNVHIVYMHVNNEINKIVCTFAFSDGLKPESAYNKSRSEPGNAPRIGIGHKEVVC